MPGYCRGLQTPKVLANFSPGFPTLGQSDSLVLLTLKEFLWFLTLSEEHLNRLIPPG